MSTAEIEREAAPRPKPAPPLLSADPMKPPGHLELPESDGRIVENYLEHPQAQVLSDALLPVLKQIHPDEQFAIGRDCGIYYQWRPPEPPLSGAIAPDWFYVPGVPPKLEGEYRRSYVLWRELVAPLIVLEFSSGDGSEELDRSPGQGKLWIYETAVRPAYYGVHVAGTERLWMFERVGAAFRPMVPDARGHYPIPELGVALGIWRGVVENYDEPWMRWYDAQGLLLPTGHEIAQIQAGRAEEERRKAEEERRRADAEASRADRLAAQLRALGIEPEA